MLIDCVTLSLSHSVEHRCVVGQLEFSLLRDVTVARVDGLPVTAAHLHLVVDSETIEAANMVQFIFHHYKVAHSCAELEIGGLEFTCLLQHINDEHIRIQKVSVRSAQYKQITFLSCAPTESCQ